MRDGEQDRARRARESRVDGPFQFTLMQLWLSMVVLAVGLGIARTVGVAATLFVGLNFGLFAAFFLILRWIDRKNRWVVVIGLVAGWSLLTFGELFIMVLVAAVSLM